MPKGGLVKGDYIEEVVWSGGCSPDYNEIELVYRIFGYSDGFPRDERGWCAFCHCDPCAEKGDGLIALYRANEGKNFETCPVCGGRAP